jgi:hypothetical protein
MLTTHLHLAQKRILSRTIPQVPLHVFMVWTGTTLLPPPPPMARHPLGGLGPRIFRGDKKTLLETQRSVRLLWTSDQLVAETST